MEWMKLGVRVAVAAVLVLVACHVVGTAGTQKNEHALALNTTEYWTEDHPYMYEPRFRRLPDGQVVPTNTSTFESAEDFRDAVTNQTPWISKWMFSAENQRAGKKDLPRLLMYTMVSPMDYGSSLRSQNVRRRRNKAATAFVTDNLALPMLKTLGRVAWHLIETHYVGYVKDEISAQRLEMMTASEMYNAFNLTKPADASGLDDGLRSNVTLAYEYSGQRERALLYARYTAGFSPYEGYSDRYYDRDDDLPTPMLPADSYPWLWAPRLNMARQIAMQLMKSIAKAGPAEDTGSNSVDAKKLSSSASTLDGAMMPSARALQQLIVAAAAGWLTSDASGSTDSPSSDAPSTAASSDVGNSGDGSTIVEVGAGDGDAMSEQDVRALKDLQLQLQEYQFATGIPRFALSLGGARTIFPSLATFMQNSTIISADSEDGNNINANLASTFEGSSGSLGGAGSAGGLTHPTVTKFSFANITAGNETDFSSRADAYTALTHFYAYPSVDKWMVSTDGRFPEDAGLVSSCLVESPCLVQSGVTVYTPSLSKLTLFKVFSDSEATAATKRTLRLTKLQEVIQVAFDAEERALKHGLQAPSTAWYLRYDLDVDEFADAVLGSVNLSLSSGSADTTPLHVFESLMVEKTPVLDQVTSYYADTNHDTKVAMEINHTVPTLDQFDDSEVAELVELFGSMMQAEQQAIVAYKNTRDANAEYQEVMNATARGDLYKGSQYTLLGFGFVVPATNELNVLCRDTKLPVPFHLVLRLIVRFQESRLLLPQESRQLLTCLAMLLHDISFYRCRTDSSQSPASDSKRV